MNNLANKTRLQLSADSCRKLLFVLFSSFPFLLTAQSNLDAFCTAFDISVFDEAYIDSLANANFTYEGHLDTICYSDASSPEECQWNDFKGHFDISRWWFQADNHDGNLHTEGLPYTVAIEGAKHSPRNNYRRYVASLKTIAPSAGYVAFDWESYGGNFYNIDAFYFTVNDSCVQLTRSDMTEGHFVSWYIAEGDTISLEQTSNGTSNHITTSISKFQFIPEEYKIIDRTWKVVDHYADTARCTQRISVLRPGLDEFALPPNRDGYDAEVLACTSPLVPRRTDYPFFRGLRELHYLSKTPKFNFSADYKDVLISHCGANRTYNRKWTITDVCSGASITKSQIIKQKDAGPIEMKCPQDQTFNISKCSVSVYIRQPRAWTSCNENIDVDISWAYGSGAKVYSNVSPGRYEITFTATDGCGLEKRCSMWLNLVYDGMNDVACKEDQHFTLPASGNLQIRVSDLIERNSSTCSNDLKFEINGSEYLDLDCSDVGINSYTIRYFDPANPTDYKTCSINIQVSGLTGSISCPDDIVVSCDADLSDLNIYGIPRVSGVTESSIVYSEDRQLNDCGVGYILRTWSINPTCGGMQSCRQRITIEGNTGNIIIEWPDDYTTEGCSGTVNLYPDALPLRFGYPLSSTISRCGVISYNYVHSARAGSQHCYMINRTWTASNTCDPYWNDTYTQKLEVRDNQDPIIIAPPDQRVFNNSAQCEGSYVNLVQATVSDCDPKVTVTNNSPYATNSGADASGTYPVGETTIIFTAEDRCGNRSTAITKIEIVANGDPALSCIGELDIQLSEDSYGNVGYVLDANQLVTSANASCGGDSYTYTFSEDINDRTVFLTCADVGLRSIVVYRYNGTTWENCQAWMSITDPEGNCASGVSSASISGTIMTASGEPVKFVKIELEGMDHVNSDDDGRFLVENIPTGNTYTVEPVKNINVRNGITTADMVVLNKHLLGIKTISSPYKLIACDINNSGSISVGDLFRMNGLVLGTINDLDRSWKFVRSDYVFPVPADPFREDIPDQIVVDLLEDMNGLDFVAVKLGDPNYSANPRRLDEIEANTNPLYLEASIDQDRIGNMEITITPPNDKMIDGMQFTLNFDPNQYSYIDAISTLGLDANLVVNESEAEFGRIGIVFINYNQQLKLEPLLLRFKGQASSENGPPVSLSSDLYKPEGYLSDKIYPIGLKYSENVKEGVSISLAPNPFIDVTNLIIDSDRDQALDISIIDVSGSVLQTKRTKIFKGTNTYTLQRTDFENAGIYVIKLSNSAISRWVRVVLID